jgi:hypothetical protein
MLHLDYHENGRTTGTLSFRNDSLLKRINTRPAVVSIFPAFAKERDAVEDFIIDVYSKTYGAKIGVHYPVLMSVQDEAGKILAALGFRNAGKENLFLEQYLVHPVEHILDTPRNSITEIGNLASAGGGASLFLFAALSAYLHDKKQSHAVVTGTKYIENRLRMLGLTPTQLAKADPSLLLKRGENWGSYYETDPYVMAGKVDRGYERLQNALGATYIPKLYSRLHYKETL